MNPPQPTTATAPVQGSLPQDIPLRDIHLPEPVSWWPPAPGWWLLLAGIILLAVVFALLRRWYKSRRLQRDIHAELEKIKQRYGSSGNKLKLAQDLSVLLRRAAISWYPHTGAQAQDIAGLTGEDWLRFLDTSGKGDGAFLGDTARVLLSAPYLPADKTIEFDAEALLALCEPWLLASHKGGDRKP